MILAPKLSLLILMVTLARRNKRGNYTGNQRAKENKWDAFKNQRKERKPKILPAERKPSHSLDLTRVCEKVMWDSPEIFSSTFNMQKSRLIAGRKSVFRMLVAFGLAVVAPSLYAQQNKAGSNSPEAAWSNIQQFVKDMETAVQSKNLHGIHEPSMKIRAPIKTLKQHSSMLSGDQGQKIDAALKQLDTSVTDLHSASDEGSQADAETALKAVESALDQLKAQDPEATFKSMH